MSKMTRQTAMLMILISVFHDPEFGVMVGCGIGGEMTEIVDDVFSRALPSTRPVRAIY